MTTYLYTGHVGYTDSAEDAARYRWAEDFLTELENSTDDNDGVDLVRQMDEINLYQNRDFLKESHTYDVIILHWIFNPRNMELTSVSVATDLSTRVSEKHSPQNWRKRLIATEAEYIFVFGSTTEVSHWFLGNIPGYDLIKDTGGHRDFLTNAEIGVYRKVEI